MGGAPVDGDPGVEDPLPGRHDVAVGSGALEDQAGLALGGDLADVRRRRRRADLLVRVRDVREALERERADGAERIDGVEAGQQPRLHVRDAGPRRDPIADREGTLGGRPGVEDGVHVSDQEQARSARRLGSAAPRPDHRSPEPAIRVRTPVDRRVAIRHEVGHEVPDPVHAVRCVRAAVDVDEPLEVVKVGALGRPNPGLEGLELLIADEPGAISRGHRLPV